MSDLEELRKENDRLKQELDAIELAKAKKEQDALKAQLEEKHRLDLEEHDKQLIAKVKAELGIGVQSKAPEQKQESNLTAKNNDWEQFRADFIKGQQNAGRTEYTGRTYEQILKDMMNKRVF
jgi:hypothetical protein